MTKAADSLKKTIHTALTTLTLISYDSTPTPELTNLRNQLRVIEPVAQFLSNRDLVVRWAWLLAAVFLGGVYVYMAFLFSFAYYGIARVGGVAYSWPEAFVTSLFIPLFAGDLPRLFWAKLLGGIQFVIILLVSFGTVYNYIHRRLDSIRAEAMAIRDRFEDQTVRERYLILQKMVDVPTKKSSAG